MTQEKIPAIEITTGIGLAKFPHLISVDPDPEYGGDYTVQLLLPADSDEAKAITEALEDARNTFRPLMEARHEIEDLEKQQKNWPIVVDTNKDGEESGMIAVRCKSKGSYKRDGKVIERPHPTFYDAVPNEVADPAAAFGALLPFNSRIRLSLSIAPYYRKATGYGVTPYITAVQVIEVAKGAKATAEECGFGAVEGGYATSPATTNPEPPPF